MTPGTPRSTRSTRFILASCIASALLAATSATAAPSENRATDIARVMQDWQARIIGLGQSAEDARSWSRRSLAKFGRLSAERLALAQRATTLGELELVLLEAPLGAGTPLNVLMANKPGDIAMMTTHVVGKSSPATSPALYAGMVFTAVSPCRILDTRPSQGGFGAWAAGSSNLVKIGPYATGYQTGPGSQGGSATSCGLDALAGPGQIAVIMAAVSTVSQTGAGYITFYPQGSPNPGLASVSQWFQPGYVQTSFVLIPSDLAGAAAASSFTSAGTEVIIDVVGYFAADFGEGTVTSVTAGTGLTGGTITTAGTIGLAATNLLPTVACSTNQIPKWSGSAWACAADATSSGGVTSVTASAPLASSGGVTPNITLSSPLGVANGGTGQTSLAANGIVYGQGTAAVGTAVGADGQVLAGTAGAPAWTGSPSISGNLTLVNPSTASAGNIMKGANRFIHNFGVQNTFIGENAGNFTMTGVSNTASGAFALLSNTSGASNTASGFQALVRNTIGTYSTASGDSALYSNTTGSANTASGALALVGNTTGSNNIASGVSALYSNIVGNGNTAIGTQALQNTTGSGNTALGYQAGYFLTTGDYNIHIGHLGLATEGRTIRIGDLNQARTFIAGIRGVTTGSPTAIPVLIDSDGQLGTVSSSRRFKDDIADMDAASGALMKLRPVTFHYKTDRNPSGRTLQYGLIAEEVAGVYPGLIAHSADGQIETVMYQFLPPMLLNEVQKQKRTIEAQATHIAGLELEIEKMKEQMARVVRLLDR